MSEAEGPALSEAEGISGQMRLMGDPSLRRKNGSGRDDAIRGRTSADPEAHATDAQFWKTAKVVLPTPKEIVTMRLDADLLRWFRRERGYQTRVNAILRAYMEAHE